MKKEKRVCDDCDKAFLVDSLSHGFVVCPFCGSSYSHLATKKEYDEKYKNKILGVIS